MRLLLSTRVLARTGLWMLWICLVSPTRAQPGDSPAHTQPELNNPTTATGAGTELRGGTNLGFGTVEGTIQYRPDPERPWKFSRYYVADAKRGSLAECVVALDGPGLAGKAAPAPPETRAIDQVNFQFVPEIVALRTGESIKVMNSDEALHNVMTSDGDQPFNVSLAKGQEFTHRFERAGGLTQPIRIGCLFHGSMRAWVFVFDHPWFAVTARDGRFHLGKVPPGRFTLTVAHPAGKLRWTRQIEVKADMETSVDIQLSADNRVISK